MLAFMKCVVTGLILVLLTWAVVILSAWRRSFHDVGRGELHAMAGGWEASLRSPTIAILLGIAFGLGVFICGRFIR